MKKHVKYIFLILLLPILFSGCGKKEELLIYVGDDKISNAILKNFERDYKIKVTTNTYSTDEEAYQKIVESKIVYDLAILPEYQVKRLQEEHWLQEFRLEKNNVLPEYQDFVSSISVPFLAGTMGVLYDADKLSEVKWSSFWDSSFFYGTIMTNNMRDAISIGLLTYNRSVNETDKYEIDKARAKLSSQRRFIWEYQTFQAKVNIAEARASFGVVYSGEAYNAINASYNVVENLKYAIPAEGSRKFVYSIVLPVKSNKTAVAIKLMKYLSEPFVQAENTKVTGYAPVAYGAKELLPEAIQNNEIIFAPEEVLKKCTYYNYNKDAYELYVKAWQNARKD